MRTPNALPVGPEMYNIVGPLYPIIINLSDSCPGVMKFTILVDPSLDIITSCSV